MRLVLILRKDTMVFPSDKTMPSVFFELTKNNIFDGLLEAKDGKQRGKVKG